MLNCTGWYIPKSWLDLVHSQSNTTIISSKEPTNVLEAAQLALELSSVIGAYAESSTIPLIAHQTWRSLKSSQWPETVQNSVNSWLMAAVGGRELSQPSMAYILWDDDGINELMKHYEPYLWDLFQNLPYPVEKADTFRVAVVRWFGGIYADVDVKLLQHPSRWVHPSDVSPWTDPETSISHGLSAPQTRQSPNAHDDHSTLHYQIPITSPTPYQELMSKISPPAQEGVGAIYGLECDTLPEADDYWRMGYTYPIQLTNWAFAMAPHHPSASAFLSQLTTDIRQNSTYLSGIDPLDLTGPPALTRAMMSHCEGQEGADFNWNSLTGVTDHDGGRGKVVADDVLILPITGFSPGRGWFHNMGSMPFDHPNARLAHVAQGSWRKTSVSVRAGKLCRTMLGRCKDWKKIS